MAKRRKKVPKQVGTLTHEEASRKNIPTAEYQSVMDQEVKTPVQVAYQRRNRDLDPQLVWRGKDEQAQSDLVAQAPPLFIQEKVHPKVLIDDLLRRTARTESEQPGFQADLFADFNGLPDDATKTEFYKHDANWSNRMILGDSLQVMASLAEREGLRGKVQCIYLDPPYGIKFNSNFQWSTTSRDVKDGKAEHISREPEQVKAFRDTWRDGIHSYLTYLRDRLTVARSLLADSGSIFVQIGDENVHRVRALMDEVFGEENFCAVIVLAKASAQSSELLPGVADFLLWYGKARTGIKYRELFLDKDAFENPTERYVCVETPSGEIIDLSVAQKSRRESVPDGRVCRMWPTFSQTAGKSSTFTYEHAGTEFRAPQQYGWQTTATGLDRLGRAGRLQPIGKSLRWKVYHDQFPYKITNSTWFDLRPGGFGELRVYVVQTGTAVIQRCILMTTDPGDLVLDPTCGSGTTAYVAEQWGRRWITIDTSRVALTLARARIMGARYPYYLLADSPEGQQKEAVLTRKVPSEAPTRGDVRQGFVYERVPHITLKSIANNAEIDVIWERWQEELEPLRAKLDAALGRTWEEWEIPREPDDQTINGAPRRRICIANGWRRVSPGSGRSTRPSPRRRTTNTSMTSHTWTPRRSVWPDHLPSRACPRTASWPWTSTTTSLTVRRRRRPRRVGPKTSPP